MPGHSQPQNGHLIINRDLCGSCGACVAVCPSEALVLINLTLHIERPLCNLCRRCLGACPVHALSFEEVYESRV